MANLVLGAAGAVVGFYVGGPTGAMYGWSIGTAIGTMVGPSQKVDAGPRIGDNQITSSTLGTPMPVLYGTMRLAGNVIDISPIRTVSHVESSDGKGGPGVDTTTYTYNADLAIDLCQGGGVTIRKIWKDSALVYDNSAAASAASVIASHVNAAGMTIYPGSETQLPDPTLEALHGAGNVPAYRGRAYIVLTQLDCPNGRIPQLSFEVSNAMSISTTTYKIADTPITAGPSSSWNQSFACTREGGISLQFTANLYGGSARFVLNEYGPGYTNPLGATYAGQGPGNTGYSIYPVVSDNQDADPEFMIGLFNGFFYTGLNILSPKSQTSVAINMPPMMGVLQGAAFDSSTGYYAFWGNAYGDTNSRPFIYKNGALFACPYSPGYQYAALAASGGVLYALPQLSSSILLYDMVTLANTGTIAVPASLSTTAVLQFYAGKLFLFDGNGPSGGKMWRLDGASWTLVASGFTLANNPRVWIDASTFRVWTGSAIWLGNYQTMSANPLGIGAIVSAECQRAGLSPAQLDVGSVTDTVQGFAATQQSSVRDNLQQILNACFVDPVEVDGVVRFLPRATRSPAATIPFTELAAVNDGSAPPDPFALQRAQEVDLPRSLAVQYMDVANDYQAGAAMAVKQVTRSINDQTIQLAMALSGDQAQRVAQVLLFNAWNTRNTRKTKLTRAWAWLAPGDLVNIEYPQGTTQGWLLTEISDDGILLDVTAVPANAELYSVTPPGPPATGGQTVQGLPAPTVLQLLDLPILRDADDNAGLYAALEGAGTPWSGAALYMGPDDSTLTSRGGVNGGAVIGSTVAALGNWTVGEWIDETNQLTVQLNATDALYTTTRDGVVTGTDNICAIGAPGRWELLQFIRASSLGSRQWLISGLKRGLRGTYGNKSNHAAGDTFVLLSTAGLLRPGFDLGQLGSPMQFRAISTGRPLDSANSITASNTGMGLKPLPLCYARGARDTSGNLTISWGRRSRYSDNWLAGIMPLGEASEAYSIDVYDGAGYANVKRTISVAAAQTASYTAAQQVADFGSNQAAVYATLYQISASIGRGVPQKATL